MLTEDEIKRLMALQPTYKFELYGCPGIVISILEMEKGFTMANALDELMWVCECHTEIEARRKPMTNAK